MNNGNVCVQEYTEYTLKFAIFDTKDDPWQCKIIIFYRKAIHKGESPSPLWWGSRDLTNKPHDSIWSWPVHLLKGPVCQSTYGPMVNVYSLRPGKSPSLKTVNQRVRCAMASSSQTVRNYQAGGQVVGTESIESMDLTDKSADQSSISWECRLHILRLHIAKTSIPAFFWTLVDCNHQGHPSLQKTSELNIIKRLQKFSIPSWTKLGI